MSLRHTLRLLAVATTLSTGALMQSPAHAQSNVLLTPLASNADTALSDTQSRYLQPLRDSPATTGLQLVRVNRDALSSDTVSIPLAGGQTLTATVSSKTRRSDNDYSWGGKLDGEGTATIVVMGDDVVGTIRSGADGTTVYQIRPLGGGLHALVTLDTLKMPPEHPPGGLPVAPGTSPDQRGDAGTDHDHSHDVATAPDNVTYDILVPYTNAVAAAVANVPALAQLAVDETNQAYADSGVNVTARLVGTMLINYTERTGTVSCYSDTDPFAVALCEITNGVGVMASVQARRDQLGADVVSLFISDSTYCGLAWLNANANNAYSVVSYNCATGYYSFGHEIGHNFGARHDTYVDSATSPYPYAHGYIPPSKNWRTVMAYGNNCGNCTRIRRFSTPLRSYAGEVTGTASTEDNVRVHNERAATIASFRAAPVATSPLAAAMLPSSRSVQVGTPATAFATIINTGPALSGCAISPVTPTPASFSYQTTNPSTNTLTGSPNTPVSIAAGGSQTFVVAFTPTGAMPSANVALNYGCSGVTAAPSYVGVNTLLLTFDTNPVADMIAIGLTPSGNGVSYLTGSGSSGVMSVATSNIGAAASLTARARLYNSATPVAVSICETNPSTGACLAAPSSTVTRTVANGNNATWSAFFSATGAVPLDVANTRVAFEFVDGGGVVRGSTSVALTTQAP